MPSISTESSLPLRLRAGLSAALLSTVALAANPAFAAADDLDERFAAAGRLVVDVAPEPDGHDYLFAFGPRTGGGYVAYAARREPAFGLPIYAMLYDADGVFEQEARVVAINQYDVRATALMPDGRVVFAEPDTAGDGHRTIVVHRRWPDGTPDATFGNGTGRVLVDENNIDLWPSAVHVDASGRIVLAGTTVPFGVPSGAADDSFVVSLAANGARDTTFGANGYSYFFMSADTADVVHDVIRDGDNRVHVCGATLRNGSFDAVLARFTSAGSLDATFGGLGGIFVDTSTTSPAANATDQCRRLALHPSSGRVYFAMSRGSGNPSVDTVRVYGVGETGTVSANTVDVLASNDFSARIGFTFDDDGRALVAAAVRNPAGFIDASLARLTSPAQVDTRFSEDGQVRYLLAHASEVRTAAEINGLFVERGRIVLGATYRGDQAGFDPNLWAVLRLQGSQVFGDGFE